MKKAIEDVITERHRQIAKGFTMSHDDKHDLGDLADAASCYAMIAGAQARGATTEEFPEDMMMDEGDWPSDWEGAWRPEDQRTNLVKAAALIIAEIERLDRLEQEQ